MEVNEWLVKEEGRLEQVSINIVTDDEEQGEVDECQNEADDSPNDDDFNTCTQNWPDWHDISIPFS